MYDDKNNYTVAHIKGNGEIIKKFASFENIAKIEPLQEDFDNNRHKNVAFRVKPLNSLIATDYIIFKTATGFEEPILIAERPVRLNIPLTESVQRYLKK